MQFTNKLQRKKLSKIKSSYVFNNKIQLFLLQSRFLWKILSLCISYTIHKKLLCSSKKSPETWSYLPNPIFFTDFNYACCSLLNSTVSKWIPDIIFLQEFTYKFFCLLVHVQIFAIFIKNHSTLHAMFLFSSSRLWFSLTAKITQNEKWPSFEGRCLNLKKNVVFVTSGWFCIITSKWMFWVFLSRTKCLFVNCGNIGGEEGTGWPNIGWWLHEYAAS